MRDIDVIAACCDLGVHVNGSNLAPQILIDNIKDSNRARVKSIKKVDYDLGYKKELEKENKKKNLDAVNKFNSKLYDLVSETVKNERVPITIGGDHSIAIASTLASINKYKDLGIIWFDAHGDFNTFETTISGNIHGLPFAALTNYEKKLLTDFHKGPFYNFKNAVLVGARDVDRPDELQNLIDAGVTIFWTEDIKKYGPDVIYKKAFEIASSGTCGIHVSYDLDVIDPKIAPGVSIPADNGINLEEAYSFLEYIIKNKENVKSLDIVEFNPLRDKDNKTEAIATYVLNKILENF